MGGSERQLLLTCTHMPAGIVDLHVGYYSPDHDNVWDPRVGADDNNVSAFCLSCHDDTIALGDATSLGNAGDHAVTNTFLAEYPFALPDSGQG